jgi:hypothetical protein
MRQWAKVYELRTKFQGVGSLDTKELVLKATQNVLPKYSVSAVSAVGETTAATNMPLPQSVEVSFDTHQQGRGERRDGNEGRWGSLARAIRGADKLVPIHK